MPFDAAVEDDVLDLVPWQALQRFDQRRPDQAFQPASVLASTLPSMAVYGSPSAAAAILDGLGIALASSRFALARMATGTAPAKKHRVRSTPGLTPSGKMQR